MIKAVAPYPKFDIVNRFGVPSNYYSSQGIKGHPALDLMSPLAWQDKGDYVVASVPGIVYKVFNRDNPDRTKYRCVFQIFECADGIFEVSYGHLDKIFVSQGDYLVPGQALGIESNTGDVFTNGHPVSPAERQLGKGTHLHWQWRKVIKVKTITPGKFYLDNVTITGERQASLYQDPQGYFYEVVDFEAGYRGCIDPYPFLYKPTIREWAFSLLPAVVQNILKGRKVSP